MNTHMHTRSFLFSRMHHSNNNHVEERYLQHLLQVPFIFHTQEHYKRTVCEITLAQSISPPTYPHYTCAHARAHTCKRTPALSLPLLLSFLLSLFLFLSFPVSRGRARTCATTKQRQTTKIHRRIPPGQWHRLRRDRHWHFHLPQTRWPTLGQGKKIMCVLRIHWSRGLGREEGAGEKRQI